MIRSSQFLLLLLSPLLVSVFALPFASRDVVDPPITYPTSGVVWHTGQSQTVTWNATGLPVNQTNPVGRLVLGYWYNNSENLMLDSPLATGLNYSTGQARITVPDVPTRSDYIIVLFGDSGNASPQFTIQNDASSSTSTPPPSVTTSPSGSPSTAPPAPAPSSPPASPDAPNNAAPSPGNGNAAGSSPSGSGLTGRPTGTAQSSQRTPSRSATVVTVTASSTSSSRSNGAWQKRVPGFETSLGISLALIYFAFSS